MLKTPTSGRLAGPTTRMSAFSIITYLFGFLAPADYAEGTAFYALRRPQAVAS